jgi:hypothetical protein
MPCRVGVSSSTSRELDEVRFFARSTRCDSLLVTALAVCVADLGASYARRSARQMTSQAPRDDGAGEERGALPELSFAARRRDKWPLLALVAADGHEALHDGASLCGAAARAAATLEARGPRAAEAPQAENALADVLLRAPAAAAAAEPRSRLARSAASAPSTATRARCCQCSAVQCPPAVHSATRAAAAAAAVPRRSRGQGCGGGGAARPRRSAARAAQPAEEQHGQAAVRRLRSSGAEPG